MKIHKYYHIVLLVVSGLAVLFLNGCAFLNTFYHARIAYNAAYTQQRKQVTENPDSLFIASGTVLTGYDRAIAKAEKMLDVYPKDKRWQDDAVFLIGKANLYKGQNTTAIRRFQQLQDEYPGSPFIPVSRLLMAQAYLGDEDLAKAEELLTTLLTQNPELNKNEEITLLLARIALKREGRMLAVELLAKANSGAVSDQQRITLTLQLAQLHMDLKQYSEAIALLVRVPRNPRLVTQMYRVELLLVRAYLAHNQLEKALHNVKLMHKNNRYHRKQNTLALLQAEILSRMGRQEQAKKLYTQLTESGDTSGTAQEAWYQLGILYQKEQGGFVKAKECFGKAQGVRDTVHARIARERLNAFALLDSLRKPVVVKKQSLPADTLDSLRNPVLRQFKIGELFWLHLDEFDSAYKCFVGIASDTTVTEEGRSRALYSAGFIALSAMNDTALADSLYTALITGYPQNRYSKQAQRDQGKPVTIALHCDSAQVGFTNAENLWHEQDSTPAAVEAYLLVARDFSDCKDVASQSLFAAAWLCDNVLYKKKTAKLLYEKLCNDFPLSDYCTVGAKPRLRTVMDSLAARKAISATGRAPVAPAVKSAPPTGTRGNPSAVPSPRMPFPRRGVSAEPTVPTQHDSIRDSSVTVPAGADSLL